MSIIEEALRRLQDPALTAPRPSASKSHQPDRVAETEAPSAHSWSTSPPQGSVQTSNPHTSHTALLMAATAIFVLMTVLVIGGAFWIGRFLSTNPSHPALPPHPTRELQPSSATPTSQAPQASSTQPAPATSIPSQHVSSTPQASASYLVLSGIVEGLGDPYAVIDGMIVGVGDQVKDATVLAVERGGVRLRRADGTELVLRVSR